MRAFHWEERRERASQAKGTAGAKARDIQGHRLFREKVETQGHWNVGVW